MSHKPKNRNKKYQPKPRVSQANQLEELLGACNDGLNVARASLHNLISRYKSSPNRTKANAQQTAVIDDYIKSAYNDITALDESLATTSKKAREVAKNYPNPEDSIIANIEISQEFEDWTISLQSSVTPTLLELSSYLDNLDELTQPAETTNE